MIPRWVFIISVFVLLYMLFVPSHECFFLIDFLVLMPFWLVPYQYGDRFCNPLPCCNFNEVNIIIIKVGFSLYNLTGQPLRYLQQWEGGVKTIQYLDDGQRGLLNFIASTTLVRNNQVSFIICMLTLLLMPLDDLHFCVGLDFVTPSL
jgi:hypothetical protein